MFVVFRARLNSVILAVALFACLPLVLDAKSKRKLFCVNGSLDAVTKICVCNQGWFGNHCQFARTRLTDSEGTISDSPSKNGYSSKCLWLIEATSPKSTIQLVVNHFWSTSTSYSLHIYNGSSFRAPLLAALSGIREKNCNGRHVTNPIKTTSRAVLIYFFRDSNNVNSGFELRYSITNYSLWCNGHGSSNITGQCTCDLGWSGDDCSIRICPYTCVHGTCDVNTWRCRCQPGFSGQSCNTSSRHAAWTNHVPTNQDIANGRIGAAVGVIGDWLWVYGGYSITDKPLKDIIRYRFSRNKWQVVSVSNSSITRPTGRHGHSLIVYNKSLIIFGGIVQKNTNAIKSLWTFNTITSQWSKVRLDNGDNPLAVAGHTATIVGHKMIVLFGYGPLYGFTNKIQEYDLVTSRWTILNTTGKDGRYGHTSHYDPVTQQIYVYGGRTKHGYSGALYSYNPFKYHWTYLSDSKVPHLLHSSVLMGHLILIFGGSKFTGASRSKCYASNLVIYDIICDKWLTVPSTMLHVQTMTSGGFGHSAVLHNSEMYIFGGFNGVMNKGVRSYSPGNCSYWKKQSSCLSSYKVSGCLWDPVEKTCIGPEEGFSRMSSLDRPSCQVKCSSVSTCGSCNAPGLNCQWCDGRCKNNSESCNEPPLKDCEFTPSCQGSHCERPLLRCEPDNGCNNDCLQCFKRKGNRESKNPTNYQWCEAQKKCLAVDSYAATLPNGQCNDWITADCEAAKCLEYTSCDSCRTVPGCGWCSDSTNTGSGRCMEGGVYKSDKRSKIVLNVQSCSKWYYMECPACQCNGHSVCGEGSSCLHCRDHTTGPHCEYCTTGYYGNPINGGTCRECQCNHHAKHCDALKCDCLVEGIVGNKCERCNREKHYEGNATNGQLCYFLLTPNSQEVFNISGKTSLNIQFSPLTTDKDLILNIKILSGPSALLNITYIQGVLSSGKKEKVILKQQEINTPFTQTFTHARYQFHKERVTFRAKLYKMDAAAFYQIQVHFNQPPTLNINLLEFFLTFFGCFLSLLFVASIGWRIRSRYHSYLVTRQRRAERDRMANRPFATIHLLLPSEDESLGKQSPSPVALEPLVKNKVAITTVIVLLPTGEEGVTPVGQCGVCFGSMLLAHGTHQHTCMRTRMGHKKSKKHATMTTYYL